MTRPPGEAELRPVIVTVDDDPGVSRAVARDLRRRYGERNRIVRAESGEQALDALRQMKLRGDQVAVIVADYRMPGLTGIEFLEQAMDIYPFARRVLLTAYADTSAAIDAINIVDLDHYLLKPWDPPEEKLYPVIDDLLSAWQREDRKPVKEAKLVGHRWSAPSAQLRDFLARNQVPYRWYASDSDEGQRLLAAAGADGRDLPVLITADGEALVTPTQAEVAAKASLSTVPARDFYDLVVVGGGPAGLGAAVYGASEGLRTVLVEKFATGGQAGQSSRIENYLGFPDGVSGGQLTDRARRQAVKFGAELLTTCEVTSLEVNGPARTIRLSDGSAISAKAVILATGVSYRQLPAPGCTEMTGAGVFYGAALTEAEACKDQDVYVVGGANSAGQAAVYLSRFARSVTMLVRAPALEQSMSYYLIQQIAAIPEIEVRVCTEVAEVHGNGHLEQLTLRDLVSGGTEMVDAGQLFIFIGAAPRTAWLDGVVARDQRGFVLAGPDVDQKEHGWQLDRPPYHLETSVPGVFAAGDVRAESAKRVASAVGEGAMAVMFVHRYLETLLPGDTGDAGGAMTVTGCDPEELRTLFLFEKLTDAQLRRLCHEGHVETIESGTVFTEGETARCLYVLIEGEIITSRRVSGVDVQVSRTSQRGVYSGAFMAYLGDRLPQVYQNSMRVTVPSRFYVLGADCFAQIMNEWFPMPVHLLEGLFFGSQRTSEAVGQRERLLALGSLTAGLTHELNNPAAAAVRATSTLRERVSAMRGKLKLLAKGKYPRASLEMLVDLQQSAAERVAKAPDLDPIETSDAEDLVSDWLEDHGCQEAWQLAPVFVQAGLDTEWLDEVLDMVGEEMLEPALRWLNYTVETELLMNEIEDATTRVTTLVGAARQYSQLDRAPYQVVDVHDLLSSTLLMMSAKLKGITIVKRYDKTLPKIGAYAAELNQVWTNLIDNAAQAMNGAGTLTVTTRRAGASILVEIGDTGPGIPAGIRNRIFEPFFTTKPVGEGTGLGLDIAWRIVVNKHHGDLHVESAPGDTRFQVRLPIQPENPESPENSENP